MPSSGVAAFTLSRDQLIAEAYRKLRVTAEGVPPTPTQISEAASRLNMVIKNCMSKGLQLWTYSNIAVPLVTGKTTYTIGPGVGNDVNVVRPLRVFENGNFVRQIVGTQTYDTPVRLISRAEYLGMGNKTAQGVVNAIYYNSHIDVGTTTSPSTGHGTLFVYVTPFDSTYTLSLNAQRPLYDMTNGTDEFDFPSEWFMYLMYALAAELADDNEVEEARIGRLEGKAAMYKEELFDWSVETASTSFQPDSQSYARR
jgi:hypothetical protein